MMLSAIDLIATRQKLDDEEPAKKEENNTTQGQTAFQSNETINDSLELSKNKKDIQRAQMRLLTKIEQARPRE